MTHDHSELVELGVASVDTLGNDGPPIEQNGQLYNGGLTDD